MCVHTRVYQHQHHKNTGKHETGVEDKEHDGEMENRVTALALVLG